MTRDSWRWSSKVSFHNEYEKTDVNWMMTYYTVAYVPSEVIIFIHFLYKIIHKSVICYM